MTDSETEPQRIRLPAVTLCAVTTVNVEATLAAMRQCLDQAEFGEAILFCDTPPSAANADIRHVAVDRLESGSDYSRFVMKELAPHIATTHCLLVQWDGFVVDARAWDDRFLEYDYIGAVWPQFDDGHDVGNGGFSLRSRKLLAALAKDEFAAVHPEDVAIGRRYRDCLEQDHGIRFADSATAQRFAFERRHSAAPSFGFHGVFNMIDVIGRDAFWTVCETLDSDQPLVHDWPLILRQSGFSRQHLAARARLLARGLAADFLKFGRAIRDQAVRFSNVPASRA